MSAKFILRMIRIHFVMFLIIFATEANSQNGFLYKRIKDSLNPEIAGYVGSENQVVIPYGKYSICYTDTIKTIGFVAARHKGFLAINNDGQELFKVFPKDNGPDNINEGLFRILGNNGLIGFANTEGSVVIKPQFKTVSYFSDGLASFCDGCSPIRNKDGYLIWRGGKWGFVDKNGDVVIRPQYDRVYGSFRDGKVKIKNNGKIHYVNKANQPVE